MAVHTIKKSPGDPLWDLPANFNNTIALSPCVFLVVWLVSAVDGYLLHKRTVPLCYQFTIAVNDESMYEQVLRWPPKSLRANLYVMLVDLDAGKIVKEEKIADFHGPCE